MNPLIFAVLACASQAAESTEPVDTTASESAADEVREVREQVQESRARLDAVEWYLADKVAVKEGRMPAGLKQPDLVTYQQISATDPLHATVTP